MVLNLSVRFTCLSQVFFSTGGRLGEERVLTEEDWALEEGCTPYEKSKTLAEKAAWELVKNLPGAMLLSILYCTGLTLSSSLLLNKLLRPVTSVGEDEPRDVGLPCNVRSSRYKRQVTGCHSHTHFENE